MSQLSDRELLVLAAKAAGVDGEYSEHLTGIMYVASGGNSVGIWNPLSNDGDVLRLAKKLFLSLDVGFGGCQIVVFRKSYGIGPEVEVVVNGDLPGATLSDEAYRRAIVCAAADIGGSIP